MSINVTVTNSYHKKKTIKIRSLKIKFQSLPSFTEAVTDNIQFSLFTGHANEAYPPGDVPIT